MRAVRLITAIPVLIGNCSCPCYRFDAQLGY
jgi:hypothetical protein